MINEKVYTLPNPGVKRGEAPVEKARAFDKRGTNRSVLHQLGKGKWIGMEFTTEENEDGEEEIQILMMRDDIEPYEGKHPYYGINVVFKRDGTVFGAAAQGDPIASRQWSREKRAIVAAAKKALDDPSLPGMYDGMGGKSVKRGKGKLPFDVTDHKLKESMAHITFKQFLLAEGVKIKEPGWYVVDHMDKPVDGPMQERGAKELADEMNEKHAAKRGKGDIDPYSAEYYSDYEIRRMNESQMIDDVEEPGWYAVSSKTGKVVEGPVSRKTDLTAAVRNSEGGEINIVQITSSDLNEAKVFVKNAYGNGYDDKPVRKGEMLADVDGNENEFVGISAGGKKLIVKRDGKQLERPASIFGAKIVESRAPDHNRRW